MNEEGWEFHEEEVMENGGGVLVSGGPGDGERGGMSAWECAGEGERRGVGICGR